MSSDFRPEIKEREERLSERSNKGRNRKAKQTIHKKHPLPLCTPEMQYTCRECCNISQRGTERKKKRGAGRQARARTHARTNTYLRAQNEEPVRLKEGIEW